MENKKRLKVETSTHPFLKEGTFVLNQGNGTDIYFAIGEEFSNGSEEYVAVGNDTTITQIKQEPVGETMFSNTPLHYRIVNQLNSTEMESSNLTSTGPISLHAISVDNDNCIRNKTQGTTTTLLPATTTVQLPSGCEIYLVKEYIEEEDEETAPLNKTALAKSGTLNISTNVTQAPVKNASVTQFPRANVKIEPSIHTEILNSNVVTPRVEKMPIRPTNVSVVSNYKKRDERRRATHNEVERRRRDKINSWIFKLKEMLPVDSSVSSSSGTSSKANISSNANNNNSATRLPNATTSNEGEKIKSPQQSSQRGGNNSRAPPSDSKSQILIKACEYIKAMQEEVSSLRECLRENEQLRVSNQQLQAELQKLKANHRRHLNQELHQTAVHPNVDDDFNDNSNMGENFTLTLCTNANNPIDDVDSPTFFNDNPTLPSSISLISSRRTSLNAPYTKRELIITDYVD